MAHEYTFPDSGVTVKIRKVSPLLLNEIQRRNPAPKPPLNKVMFGDEEKLEENRTDPDYLAAVAKHEQELELKLRRVMLKFGVYYELTAEDVRQVNDLRAFWKEESGEELEGTDLEIFVAYILIGTIEDLQDLTEAITRRSHPTEAAIAEAVERFPSEVSRS